MIRVKRGDLFATRNPMFLGRAINFIQKLWSPDNKSEYSHTGIITSMHGDTLESNWHIECQNLFTAYAGKKVMIARHVRMNDGAYNDAINKVFRHYGKLYPFWRLPLHIIPVLAKYIHIINSPVCSELVAEFLYRCGFRHCQYMGTNVDTLADEWIHGDDYEIVWEGVLPETAELSPASI